jgi:hypothetical protein
MTPAHLTLAAVAALAAAGAARRGSRAWEPQIDARFSTWGDTPTWRVEVFYGKGMYFAWFYTLDGQVFHRSEPAPKMRQKLGLHADPDQIVAIEQWMARHRAWGRHLLSLPIDWSQPLYVRLGEWGAFSRVFLDDEEVIGQSHGFVDRVTQRRYEAGVSVLGAVPTGTGWGLLRPMQSEAVYGLPRDYMAGMLRLARKRPAYLLQGDRVQYGETYDDYGEGPYPVYAYGADGEPLLDASTIRLIAHLTPDQLEIA